MILPSISAGPRHGDPSVKSSEVSHHSSTCQYRKTDMNVDVDRQLVTKGKK